MRDVNDVHASINVAFEGVSRLQESVGRESLSVILQKLREVSASLSKSGHEIVDHMDIFTREADGVRVVRDLMHDLRQAIFKTQDVLIASFHDIPEQTLRTQLTLLAEVIKNSEGCLADLDAAHLSPEQQETRLRQLEKLRLAQSRALAIQFTAFPGEPSGQRNIQPFVDNTDERGISWSPMAQ